MEGREEKGGLFCLTARLFEVWDPLLRSQHFDIRALKTLFFYLFYS